MTYQQALGHYYENKPAECVELETPGYGEIEGDHWVLYNVNGRIAKVHYDSGEVLYG